MVGSDKERPRGRVGSGSDNARGSTILNKYTIGSDLYLVFVKVRSLKNTGKINIKMYRTTYSLIIVITI